MSEFQYCPYCSAYVSGGSSSCPSCSRIMPSNTAAHVEALRDASMSIGAQTAVASNMLAALFNAHALPLISLLEEWWGKLTETDKNQFAKSLMMRCLKLVYDGALDDKLKPLVESLASDDERISKLAEGLPKKMEGPLTDAISRLVEKELDRRGSGGDVSRGMEEAIIAIAKEQTMGHREVIEAAVRDRMPDIEEMTKRIVKDVADQTAREVRDRMRRDS